MPKPKTSAVHHLSDESLLKVVDEVSSIRQLMMTLNLRGGSNFVIIRERIKKLGRYEKFENAQFWNRGKSHLSDSRIKSSIPDDRFFSKDSHLSTGHVKKLLLAKLQASDIKCYECQISTWNEKPLSLELDHIDGDSRNNEIENLRLLCSNCHSQTSTWRGRNINKGRQKVSDEELLSALHQESNIHLALKRVGLAGAGNYGRCYRLLAKELKTKIC